MQGQRSRKLKMKMVVEVDDMQQRKNLLPLLFVCVLLGVAVESARKLRGKRKKMKLGYFGLFASYIS